MALRLVHSQSELDVLIGRYASPMEVPIPEAHAAEAALPGAEAAWRAGVETERERALLALREAAGADRPMDVAIRILLEGALDEASDLAARFRASSLRGLRLSLLGRAEMISRFARDLAKLGGDVRSSGVLPRF